MNNLSKTLLMLSFVLVTTLGPLAQAETVAQRMNRLAPFAAKIRTMPPDELESFLRVTAGVMLYNDYCRKLSEAALDTSRAAMMAKPEEFLARQTQLDNLRKAMSKTNFCSTMEQTIGDALQ
jgi:hypothetical protein